MKKHPTEQSKARQRNLFVDERSLFEKLCDLHNLQAGFKAVKKNGGAPGVDEVTVEEYASRLDEELAQLKKDLEGWSYKPNPVRRVEIPKPGIGAGVRLLGVPCIRDRLVHATLKLLLEPILDPTFSDHSYGLRPGYISSTVISRSFTLSKCCGTYYEVKDVFPFSILLFLNKRIH